MSIEGRLGITLRRNAAGGVGVEIASSRPFGLVGLFVSKTPAELLALVPSLFSVCAIAQTTAAISVCEQALEIQPSPDVQRARMMAVWAETAREHILRITLDWGAVKHSENLKALMPLAQNIKGVLGQVFVLLGEAEINVQVLEPLIAQLENYLKTQVFGMALEAWLAMSEIDDLACWSLRAETQAARHLASIVTRQWCQIGGEGIVQVLPTLDAKRLYNRLGEQEFIAKPSWDDAPKETSALTRTLAHPLIGNLMTAYGSGLLTRFSALLVELAGIPALLRRLSVGGGVVGPQSAVIGPGIGLAQVEAARGLLVHGVRIKNGKITDYHILAPTEWNFHPRGCAARGLESLAGREGSILLEQATMLINAIDPCVACDVRIG